MASKGVSYKNHLATIRNWARKDGVKAQQKPAVLPNEKFVAGAEEREGNAKLRKFLEELRNG